MRQAWIFLAVAVCCNVAANILVKYASLGARSGVPGYAVYFTLPFLIGVVFFGLNLLAYSQAIKSIPLVIGYPVMVGASLAGVTLLALTLFGETLQFRHWAGMAFAAGAILLLSS